MESFQYGETDLTSIHFIHPTPAQFRDLALTRMISSGPGIIKSFLPTPKELDTVSDMLYEAVAAGKMIDFGHWPNDFIKTSSERACHLYMQGALGHPFTTPWVFMHTWNDMEQDEYIGWTPHKHMSAYLVNPFPDNSSTLACDVEIVTLEAFEMPVGKGPMKMLAVGDRGVLMPKQVTPSPNDEYACSVIPVQLRFPQEFYDSYATAVRKPTGVQAALKAAAANTFEPFFIALLMLNTKGLPSETIRAADKLNKARIKNNKYPIPSYRKIDSEAYVTTMMNRYTGVRVDRGGTHASPVAHIRHGHWRNYKSGERTFINDTLVNATPEMREMFRSGRTMYKVKDNE